MFAFQSLRRSLKAYQSLGMSLGTMYGYRQIFHCRSAAILNHQELISLKRLQFLPSVNFFTSIKYSDYYEDDGYYYDKRHYMFDEKNKFYIVMHEDDPESPEVNFTATLKDKKTKVNFKARVGNTVMKAIHKHNEEHGEEIPMECACSGAKACTTCHVYCDEGSSDIFTQADVYEEDILDTAKHIKTNSRLSCQMKILKPFDHTIEISMPLSTVNFSVDKRHHRQ